MIKALAFLLALSAWAETGSAQDEASSYLFYVASESDDEVTLLRFDPAVGLTVEKEITVGLYAAENESPHGVFLSPDKDRWYVTLGHGFPFGSLWEYETGTDTAIGRVDLGLFPSTVSVPPFGGLAFVANSNFHGDMVPGTVSIVDLQTMTELEQVETCVMPHGSRFSADGLKHYSVCMRTDELIEIDLSTFQVSRRLDVAPSGAGRCSPTWVQPTGDGQAAFVACNQSHELLEISLDAWSVTRRLEAPSAPYNIAVTPDDGRVVVTQKGSAQVSIWDRATGRRIALLPSARRVTHGVAVSPDSRYAFVSVEGIGGEPGAVDVIDLESLEVVATQDVGKQAGGIAFWKMENS